MDIDLNKVKNQKRENYLGIISLMTTLNHVKNPELMFLLATIGEVSWVKILILPLKVKESVDHVM